MKKQSDDTFFASFRRLLPVLSALLFALAAGLFCLWLWQSKGSGSYGGSLQSNSSQESTTGLVKRQKESSRELGEAVRRLIDDMVHVSGGSFTMGATIEQEYEADDDEWPDHNVTVGDFYICKYEVTQALWQEVMGNNPSGFKGGNRPVESVSWDDCLAFVKRLNDMTGKDFRLPTEAEWEFAARGGVRSNGHMCSGSEDSDQVAWHEGNSGGMTHAVGMKLPNELGLYDMSGNVMEWCSDWYGKYSSADQTDPRGASGGSNRVIRGGSWGYNSSACRTSARRYSTPSRRYNRIGVRLAASEL